MKRSIIIVAITFVLLVAANLYLFRSLTDLQINHQKNLLQSQTQICKSEIERVVQRFESDLNYILFSDDISEIFKNENSDDLRKLQLFYTTYNNLVKNIDIYDNNKNVLNVFRDKKKNFITDNYIAQRQRKLTTQEEVLMQNSKYQYVLPVFRDDEVYANILVTINISDYILSELNKFHLKGYTWQWVVDIDNNQIYGIKDFHFTNFEGLDKMNETLNRGLGDILIHDVETDSVNYKFLTIYSPIKVLNKDFGIAMSTDYSETLHQINSKVFIISLISLLIFIAVVLFLLIQIRTLKKKLET